MHIFGKLSTTNGCSISVDDGALRGHEISAVFLSNDGDPLFTGPLRITQGRFINSPKDRIRTWMQSCGRTDADIPGQKNPRNTVYCHRDANERYHLHFAEFQPSSQAAGSARSSPRLKGPLRAAQRSADVESPQVLRFPEIPQSIGKLRGRSWRDVPNQPGVYWWFFPEQCLETLRISEHCDTDSLNLKRSASGKVCLYVGVGSSLEERIRWHSEQRLTLSALRSGFLSTFRKTLLVLNRIEYSDGFDEINRFMDGLNIAWQPTADLDSARQIESAELNGPCHYPLNIQGNVRLELQAYIRFLKRQRKEYTDRSRR